MPLLRTDRELCVVTVLAVLKGEAVVREAVGDVSQGEEAGVESMEAGHLTLLPALLSALC